MNKDIYSETVINQLETEIKRLKNEIKFYKYDHLTGLALRKDFEDMLETLWYEYKKYKHRFILAIIDINNLKEANDEYGHHYGDAYIVSVTNQLKSLFEDSFIYRIGGDEFIIIKRGDDEQNFIERLNKIKHIEYGCIQLSNKNKFTDEFDLLKSVDDLLMKKKRDKRRGSK